jgi:diguanylate cyclase (GGDEF)-like protein
LLEIPQHLIYGLTRLNFVKWLDSLWTQVVAVALLLGIVGLLVLGVVQAQRELAGRDADEARVVSLETLERSASRAQFLAADMNGWQTAYALEFRTLGVRSLERDGAARARFLQSARALDAELGRLEARRDDLEPSVEAQLGEARAAFSTFMNLDAEVVRLLRAGDVRGADALVLGREIEVFERASTALQSITVAVNRQVTQLNLERRGADGAAYRQLLTFSAAVAISLALMLILSALNFQQRTRLIQRLSWQARTDGLTGVLNRRAWDESYPLALARARRAGQRLSVVMLDLDRFKAFNDAYGHAAGDKLLRMTAQCLQRGTRMTDIVARYGGEEFALVLEGCTAEDAQTLLERIKTQLPEGRTFSAGIAETDGDEQPGTILERADRALYAAKRAGRDRILIGAGTTSTRDSSVTLATQVA